MVLAPEAAAHGVPEGDLGYLQATDGVRLGPFAYLGAKHMVTGYDHLLFLLGVLFFLYRFRDVALYTALFAVGHSITMLAGVLLNVQVNAYLVDAVIGLSVAYKALDNLGTLDRWLGFRPDPRAAVLAFGLVHGLGLATKVLEFDVGQQGLVPNLLAFNVGVEAGQALALAAILLGLGWWRRAGGFERHAAGVNVAVLVAGIALTGYQLAGYVQHSTP